MAGARTIKTPEEYWQYIGSKHSEALVADRLGLGKQWEEFAKKNWKALGMHQTKRLMFDQFLTAHGKDPKQSEPLRKKIFEENMKKAWAANNPNTKMPPAWS